MRDHDLHRQFDRWLEKSAAKGKNDTRVLRGRYAAARMRYVDGVVHVAVVMVKRKHQRQGLFASFLAHCEETGREVVVEFVENEHLQRFMERRSGYAKEDTTDGFAPTGRRLP